ncbi:MAG: hypothetical protein NTV86_12280 [Planctomycetota bacterium]|nr:hypothetical protein [Planctomycetota bacterium]
MWPMRWTTAGWMLACVLSVGCAPRTWAPFENLAVGRAAPDPLPGEMHRFEFWLLEARPIMAETQTRGSREFLRALVDADGRVVAKSYTYLSVARQAAAVTGEYCYILELEVPAEAFRDAPASWRPAEELEMLAGGLYSPGLVSRQAAGSTASRPAAVVPPTSLPQGRQALGERLGMLRTALTEVHDKTNKLNLFTSFRTRLDVAAEIAGLYLRAMLGPLPAATATRPAGPTYPAPANAAEFAIHTNLLLASGPPPEKLYSCATTTLFEMAFRDVGRRRLAELLGNPAAFAGVTRDDWKWTLTSWDGVRMSVRRLPGRRIRIEVSGTVIRDPILFPL